MHFIFSGAFIIAGVIGVAITFLSNVWDLHYSLILAAKSGGLILLSGCFLLADLITRGIDPNRGQDSDRSFSRNNKRSESSEHLKPKDKTNKSNERRLGDYVKSEQQKKNISISNQFSEINGYSNQIDYDETLSNGHVSVNTDDKNAQDDYGFESDVYRKKSKELNEASESDIKGSEHTDFDRKYARFPRESYYDQISANLDNKSQDVPNGNDNHISRNEMLYGDSVPMPRVINTHKKSYGIENDYINQSYGERYQGQLFQEIQQPIDFNIDENPINQQVNILNKHVNKFKPDKYMHNSREGEQANTQTQEMQYLGQHRDKDYNYPYSAEPNPYSNQYNAGIGNTDNHDKYHQRDRRRKHRGTGNTQRSNANYEADEYSKEREQSNSPRQLHTYETEQPYRQDEYPKQREQSNSPRQLHAYETEQPYRQDEYPKQREQSISPRQLHTYETEQPYKQDADQLYVVLPETSQSIWPCSKSRSPEPYVTSQTGASRRHTTETEV